MSDKIKFMLFVVLGALLLMADAIYNGFPIVYSDTSTYIASGLEWETPFDRPITYGLFLRVFSLNGWSLWFVIFFQGLILSYLIFLIVRLITNKKSNRILGLLIILGLSLFSSVSWTTSQLMPDVFTPVGLFSASLILLGRYNRSTNIFLYSLFFISVSMHMSHVLLFCSLLGSLFLLRKFVLPFQHFPNRNIQIAILFLLSVGSVFTMGSAIAKSKHAFFFGAMVEHGIVKNYLHDHCDDGQYKLCVYVDSLPERAYEFLWDRNSPFYKIGGWKGSKTECNEIIYGTLTDPKYVAMHIKESFRASCHQLTLFAIGDGNGSFIEGTSLHERVSTYFPYDLKTYVSSRQNQSRFDFVAVWNPFFQLIVAISVILLIIFLSKCAEKANRDLGILIAIFFIGIILNAWSCGTFANAIDRLGCKMIWLLPFGAMLFVANFLQYKKVEK